ncbi:DNA polymerase III, chi subunit, putative [Oceanicola granulosus HTCC2516]|uniref:DNA polymerase III, chi subunit, putative n=1 Tax=Oceanicola granulosus (strain ATCC BAA-861 / DSM 15982 / KCTC 12143 / HTCC2516) TaxID=314256 RepID=Q2CC18_OCEGH|nr:DNA polymerase III subunit chi [Oceanicola granulosus]EAR50176.1 DNA polymerase III, chi subunit, putative [Oceanicola granulosus HTCC2516]
MGAAYFYHLTRDPLERTLPMLLEKARTVGWRCEVRATSRALLARLDEQLWLHPEDGFLPHGLAGGPHDADQPVLLTDTRGTNNAACLLAVEGAEVSAEEVQALERTCILFDGADPGAVQIARGQWARLTDAGCAAQYWSQESGRWEKKAER